MSTLEIRGDGRVIRGAPSPSTPTGLFVGRDGLQGWQGLPARRREALVRALSDGEHDVPVRLPSRVITIDPGHVLAESEFDLRKLCDKANGWGARGNRFDLTVDQLGQMLTATVRVIAAEAYDRQRRAGGMFLGAWSATLVAPDPRKYAPPVPYTVGSPGGSVWVSSEGNFPAHPTIEIPDAPSSYSVSSMGGVFTVTGATGGGTHRVDLMTGRVYRNGVLLPGVGHGQLWAIPNGTQWQVFLSAPGRVIHRDTFV